METQYFKQYSHALDREMECKVYGYAGRPVLYIPCQDGRFFDFENFSMTDVWSPWINSGQVMVFAIDTIDKETWSNENGDPRWRICRHEQWMRYITDEMVPFMRNLANDRNGWTGYPGVMVLAAVWVPPMLRTCISADLTYLTGFWHSAVSILLNMDLVSIWTIWFMPIPRFITLPTCRPITHILDCTI